MYQTEKRRYPSVKTLAQLFEEQANKTPDNVAIIHEKEKITYKVLNESANRLAHKLCKEGVRPESIVAILAQRSIKAIVGILGVLKAGGAYLPIDPLSPNERVLEMLDDASVGVLLSQPSLFEQVSGFNGKIIDLYNEESYTNNIENVSVTATSNNLAYVIYTSGSTGKPKGVMIEHGSVVNLLAHEKIAYGVDEKSKNTQLASLAFDAAVFEIYPVLVNGGELHIITESIKQDPVSLSAYLASHKITFSFVPPALFAQMPVSPHKQFIVVGGEKSDACAVQKWVEQGHTVKNAYGPTEATVYVTGHIFNKNDVKEINNIGSPIRNASCYLVERRSSESLKLVPVGLEGELYIGGAGVARGYLNRPSLTKEKFIDNLFASEENKSQGRNLRLYKTGDLCRWREDGTLVYLGRTDEQIKIRGYRIEPEEIASQLSSYPGIQQSVVLVKEHHKPDEHLPAKHLIAYYVSADKLDEEVLLNHLRHRLPAYMLPNTFVHLAKLPLTLNGKLDRSALPEPEFVKKENYIAPRNPIEQQLCAIWGEVLGLSEDKIGIDDDFFSLGGDSIVAIQLVSRIKKQLHLNPTVKNIFSNRTVRQLHDNIGAAKDNKHNISIRTEQGRLNGSVQLLPIQRWFFANDFAMRDHWNQSFIVKTPNLDINKLSNVIPKLVSQHDALRLRYKKHKEKIIQYYDQDAAVPPLKTLDINQLNEKGEALGNKIQTILTDWQSDFDIIKGPTYSIGYLHGYKDGSARVYFALHHLMVDTISWRILAEDLRELYQDKELGLKGSSYRQWVSTVREYADINAVEEEYWQEILRDQAHNADQLKHLTLSNGDHVHLTDWQKRGHLVLRESNRSSNTQGAFFSLSKARTQLLLQETHKLYNTEINDILLTALGYALSEITGSKIHHIVLEGHGREEIDARIDINKTVGWFTIMYPVRLEIGDELGTSISTIKEVLRKVPNKGIGYGGLFGYEIEDLPKVSFNYLGQFDTGRQEEKLWNIIDENAGVSMHPHNHDSNIININGSVINGKLQFSIVTRINQENTDKLANAFRAQLEYIIGYTSTQTRSYLTISDVGNVIDKDYLNRLQKEHELESLYLANSLQEGFIYHNLHHGGKQDVYKCQFIFQYKGAIEQEKLKTAWSYAQKRYPSLRTALSSEKELVQIIHKKGQLSWRYADLTQENFVAQQISRIKEADSIAEYKLAYGSLFRVYLIKQRDDLFTCIFSTHHAVLDGWSVPILFNYVHNTYSKLVRGDKVSITTDHSYLEAQAHLQKHKNSDRDYWDKYLSQVEEKGDFTKGLLLDSKVNLRGYKTVRNSKTKVLKIKTELQRRLTTVAQQEGVTLNTILQYAWHKLLSVYENSNQTISGLTMSGRNLPIENIEASVGLYINTLPLIVNHTDAPVAKELQKLQHNINEIATRSNIHLAVLQQGTERLFYSLFVEILEKVDYSLAGLPITLTEVVEKTDYPLGVAVSKADNHLALTIQYAGELFADHVIADMLKLLESLLEQIAYHPTMQANQLKYLPDDQYNKIVYQWNKTDKGYPQDKTIHDLLEEQVERTPENVAVVYQGLKLTYREVNESANRLANYLIGNYAIKADDLIVLCVDRNEHMIIGMLGILKSGAAYVPIDPSYPDARIETILKDTKAGVVLCSEVYQARLERLVTHDDAARQELKTIVENIDSKKITHQLSEESNSNPVTKTGSNNLAYVIYTSGSTGKPKGVMIEHESVVNLSIAEATELSLNNAKKVQKCLFYANYVFDAHVWDIYTAMLNGHVVHVINNATRQDIKLLSDYVTTNGITIGTITPILLDRQHLLKLAVLVVAGDQPDAKILDWYKDHGITVINAYGPSEATVCTSLNHYDHNGADTIGKPLRNIKCYILTSSLTPVPIGAIGELYIGGAGVARGYLNKPALTKEKFIDNPFASEEDKSRGRNLRLYKTGDLCRWRADGNMVYVGRIDDQVKIRGYRIEPEEIASQLSSYPGIQQSVVLVKEHHKPDEHLPAKHLIAYYVSAARLDEASLRNHLHHSLPAYMLPNAFVHLSKLPLTLNGKLDQRALPDPAFVKSADYVAPRNDIEQQLCALWGEVLGIDQYKVGIRDDFFETGGNSILAVQLVSKINAKFSLDSFRIQHLFDYRIIEKIALDIQGRLFHVEIPTQDRHLATNKKEKWTSIRDTITENRDTIEDKVTENLLQAVLLEKEEKVIGAALGYLPDTLPHSERFASNTPLLAGINGTPYGRIAYIMLPITQTELYAKQKLLVNLIIEALKLSKLVGADVASLTGVLPSATGYGILVKNQISDTQNVAKITTGNPTTCAAILLNIEDTLKLLGKNIKDEIVGILGLGAIGSTVLKLMLACGYTPKALLLYDPAFTQARWKALIHYIKNEYDFTGSIQVLQDDGYTVPEQFYDASFIIGATNVPNVLKVSKIRPGSVIIDDSGPLCFNEEEALERVHRTNDFLFKEAGSIFLPECMCMTFDKWAKSLIEPFVHKRKIGGCVFSSIIPSLNTELPSFVGPASVEICKKNYSYMKELGIKGSDMSTFHNTIDTEIIRKFKRKFGN